MPASSQIRRWAAAALTALGLADALPARATPRADEDPPLSQSVRERWTYRDGLPHNVVHRLLVSRTGYLWLGTQEGLVRFDGVRFQIHSRAATPGLAGDQINALLEDGQGTLWIGTSRGLSRLAGDRFGEVALGADAAVTDLAPDGEGGIWVATEAAGVVRVRAGAPPRVEGLDALRDRRVVAIAQVGGEAWFGGYGGLWRLAGGRLEEVEVPGREGAAVTRILEARDRTVWVGTHVGLWRLGPGGGALERFAPAGRINVQALGEDRRGALWVGTDGGPLLRIRRDRAEPVAGEGSPVDCHAIAVDGDGDVWAGTETGGLHRLRWGPVVTVGREEGLSGDVVWAVREARGGGMWVATDVGLDRWRAGGAGSARAPELRGSSLGGLLEDRAGHLWVGAGGELVRLAGGRVTRYGQESGLSGSLPRTLHEDARGVLWVGTSRGLFRREGERFVPLAAPGVASEKINVIEQEPGGGLWVGTTGGLARVEGDRLVPAGPAGQPFRGDVAALRADPDGSLWIGTVAEGLLRLSGERLERWTRRQGLYEDTVLAILDDGKGHLWTSGNKGITRLGRAELAEVAAGRRAALAPRIFGTPDGMRERECNGGVTPAAWRASDGRLWFATIRGAAVIDPDRLSGPAAPPPARVEELVVDGRPVPPGAPHRFPPGTRRVEVRYTGLALAAADRVRFRHRLSGLDEAFLDAGGERAAHYTGLGPGRYLFEVAAASSAGAWGAPAAVAFEIEPHLWQTPWFALAAALAGLGALIGVYRARTAGLRRRQVELTARVEEEMGKVKVLTGLLPTCAWCQKIRDEHGEWHRFEAYVSTRTDAQFTHGMCPECFERTGREGRE